MVFSFLFLFNKARNMSKRESFNAALDKNDRSNDPGAILRKKIKTEHDYILSRTRKINEDIDLTEHEVNKFLIVFHTLLETVDLDSDFSEETDGVITDIIIKIVIKISELIRQNVDSLPLPNILKDALKVIKDLFNAKKSTTNSKGGSMETELKEFTSPTSGSSSSSVGETTSSSSTSSTSTSTSASST